LPNIKHQKEDRELFDEDCVKALSPRIVGTNFCSEICYLLNLPNSFEILLENQLTARLKILLLTV